MKTETTSASSLLKAIQDSKIDCSYKCNEPMSEHTSFKIGGPVDLMFFPKSSHNLNELNTFLRDNDIKPLIIGRGTNLLVDDKPLNLVVINTLDLNSTPRIVESESIVSADAGIGLNSLAMFAYENNLTGLEFAHGIPGTLGGAIKMNAGAYGSEIGDVVYKTAAINSSGQIYYKKNQEHEFKYRLSWFTDNNDIIIHAYLKLQKADKAQVKAKMDDFSERRRASQPLNMPSAGSVFKRPEKGYAADLIDKAGLKGHTIGGAQISKKHAGFIVNLGNASFSDVMALINHAQEEVYKLFNVKLEPEIKIIR